MIQVVTDINYQHTEEKCLLCFIYESETIFSSLLTHPSDSYQAKTLGLSSHRLTVMINLLIITLRTAGITHGALDDLISTLLQAVCPSHPPVIHTCSPSTTKITYSFWTIPMGALFPIWWSSLHLTYPLHVTITQLNIYVLDHIYYKYLFICDKGQSNSGKTWESTEEVF